MTNPKAPASRFRWTIILLLFLINMVNYIDHSAIAFAAHAIRQEFDLYASQLGLVLGAFGIGYLLTTFPRGYVADRFGARITFAIAVTLWSVAIGWTGAATGFAILYCARVVLGLAERPSFPAHAHCRTLAAAAGKGDGNRRCPCCHPHCPCGRCDAGHLPDRRDRLAGDVFRVRGRRHSVAAGLALFFCREFPGQSRFVTEGERAYITQQQNSRAAVPASTGLSRSDWRILLTTPTLLAGYWFYFVFGYLLFFVMTWLPEFLRTTYHLDLRQIGWAASLPWAVAAVALYAAGRLSDWLMSRTGSLRIARSYLMASPHGLVAIAVLPLAFVDSLPAALACMSVAVAAGFGANPMFYAVIADVVPRSAGTCMAVMNSGLALSGFLAPVITGYALQATGDFAAAFGLISLFAASSVIVLLIWHHPDRDVERIGKAGPDPAGR